jgi:gamma-glutamylcyclotransferase
VRYFAYGTLLDVEGMKSRYPSAEPLGIFRLDGYRMTFARCADGSATGCSLEADPAAVTYGIEYQLSDEDMQRMDSAAVRGQDLWVHQPIRLVAPDGRAFDSVTYVIPGDPPRVGASSDYVRPILKGLDELDLPADYKATMRSIVAEARTAR